jgi:hypothetical protein
MLSFMFAIWLATPFPISGMTLHRMETRDNALYFMSTVEMSTGQIWIRWIRCDT